MKADDHRRLMGFLTVAETEASGEHGVRVLDPFSTLISSRAVIGRGTVVYPTAIVGADPCSSVSIGERCVLYPGTIIDARDGGQVTIADDCELGPGGVVIRAHGAETLVEVGREVRLSGGCELTGECRLGLGAQILGAILARSVRLGGGRGGHRWPQADERGAVLKGTGIADGITLDHGQVINCRCSFADAPIEAQSRYHPPRA